MKHKTAPYGLFSPAKIAKLTVIVCAALASKASASVIIPLSTYVSGEDRPESNILPWVTATFETFGAAATPTTLGIVKMRLTATNLTGAETIDTFGFNVDDSLFTNVSDPLASGALKFSLKNPIDFTIENGSAFDLSDPKKYPISYSKNNVKLGNSDGFDILFDLPPPPGDNTNRLTAGESLVVYISAIGLTEGSFNVDTASGVKAGAHIISIDSGDGKNSDSAWIYNGPSIIIVPEPGGSVALVGLISCGLLLRSRRKANA